MIIICLKIYKDRNTYFWGKIVIRVINSLVFLPWVPEPLQISTYTNSFNLQHSLRGNHLKIKLKHWLYLYISFHHEAGFENSFLNVLQNESVGSRWPLCGPGPAWGGCPGILPSPSLSPWTSQLSLQAPNVCLPHDCREGDRVLKAVDSGKGRKAK